MHQAKNVLVLVAERQASNANAVGEIAVEAREIGDALGAMAIALLSLSATVVFTAAVTTVPARVPWPSSVVPAAEKVLVHALSWSHGLPWLIRKWLLNLPAKLRDTAEVLPDIFQGEIVLEFGSIELMLVDFLDLYVA